MIMFQDFMDPWTFNQKNVMKCCKEILLPDGKQIPFCNPRVALFLAKTLKQWQLSIIWFSP